MKHFNKRDPEREKRVSGDLFDEIHGRLTEKEIEELERDAEKREAYERARLRAKRRRLVRVVGTMLLLIILTVSVVLIGYKLLFRISRITVEGESPYTDEEIVAATGVETGDGLYSFSSVTVGERLVAALPCIESLEVDRHIPNKITFTVKCEEPVYYTDIYGKIYLMSDSLRILGESGNADLSGLIWLKLGHVREAEFGQVPVLRDKTAQKYLTEVTEKAKRSPVADRITQIDLSNIYELSLVCDNKYLLEMGEYDEIDTKLKIAEAVLGDDMFNSDNKARLDLSELSETKVIIDNKLNFEK